MPIAIGDVFLLRCNTCREPKPKFFVVALLEPFRCFLINSAPTAFQASRPEQMLALAPILANQHPFLSYNSYVGCNELFAEYSQADIEAAEASDPSVRLGSLHPHARAAVAAALTGNRFLPKLYLAKLQNSWV